MTSKRLESILGSVPSATAKGEIMNAKPVKGEKENLRPHTSIEYTRIVATIPQVLKDEIKKYIRNNKGDTETTVVLRALKKMGFNVEDNWIVDKRSTR